MDFDCRTVAAIGQSLWDDDARRLEEHLVKNCVVLDSSTGARVSFQKIRCKSCGVVWIATYEEGNHGMYAQKIEEPPSQSQSRS